MPIMQGGADHSTTQKLSKIETLRLARNYILAMSQTLQEGKPMDIVRFIRILSRELSQTTANLLNGSLIGPVNNNFTNYRRYLNDDCAMNSNNVQEVSNIPYHIEWHNDSCGGNNNYNPWYANYNKLHGNVRFERYSENYSSSESCVYDSYPSKQLFYTEW